MISDKLHLKQGAKKKGIMGSSVYIETLGCQMNVADTERAATSLRAAGYDLANSEGDADVIIFNTCSVREKASQKVFHRIEDLKSSRRGKVDRPIIGIMGCVAQLEGETVFDHESAINF